MRQRVALMRTLAMHRDVMLLDEPFGALDSQTRLSMQQWLLDVWAEQKRTIVFVTHDIDEAIFLADRVMVMTPRPGPDPGDIDGADRAAAADVVPDQHDIQRAQGAHPRVDIRRYGDEPTALRSRAGMANRISGSLILQIVYPLLALVLVIVLWAVLVDIYRHSEATSCRRRMQVWEHIAEGLAGIACGLPHDVSGISASVSSSAPAPAFVFAVIMDASRSARGVLYPILITSQAIPVVAISAALTIWLGFGLAPKLVIVALVMFFPVVVNVLDGLASVDRDLLNLVRSMGASKFSIFRHVKLPATYSPLFSALKLSATFSVTGAVIAEWTASTSGGLGAYLLQANSRLNTAGTFSAIAFLALLGVVAFFSSSPPNIC